MQARTRRFLRSYVDCLRVQDSRTCLAQVAAWQSANMDEWLAVCPDLNEALALTGEEAFLPHIPTTCVGRLDGLVAMAANPGWNRRRNDAEHRYRKTPSGNDRFIREFFGVYPAAATGTSAWWTKVLRTVAAVRNDIPSSDLRGAELWRYAHRMGWQLGGVDLVPFHSAKDGVTPLLAHPRSAGAELMREIAVETLRMTVLRVQPRVVLIASRTGADLFRSMAPELGACRRRVLDKTTHGIWMDAEIFRAPRSRTRILLIPRQVFSGRCPVPPGYKLSDLAPVIRLAGAE